MTAGAVSSPTCCEPRTRHRRRDPSPGPGPCRPPYPKETPMADRETWTFADDNLVRTALAGLGRRADLAVRPGPARPPAGDRPPAHRPRRRASTAWAGGIAAAGACAVVYLSAQAPAREVVPAVPGPSSITPAPTPTASRTPGTAPPRSLPTRPTAPLTRPFEGWHIIPLPVHPPPTIPGEMPAPTVPPHPSRVPDLRFLPAQPPRTGGTAPSPRQFSCPFHRVPEPR